MDTKLKQEKRDRRRKRIRAKVFGTSQKPRVSIFKSNKYIYAQIIDDESKKTIASASSKTATGKTLSERANNAGKELAKAALSKSIDSVVFDRGGYVYTGVIRELAEGAREGGLKF